VRYWVLGLLFATIVGAGSGWIGANRSVSGRANFTESFSPAQGNWFFSDTVGSPASSALERARVAVSGPLALSSTETIYFLTMSDAQGRALNSSCVYQVGGGEIDTRWWSITIYDARSGEYIPNEDNRASWNSVAIPRDENGQWQFTISSERPSGLWLAAQSTPDEPFELLLRLYNPSGETRAAALELNLPVVERLSC